MLLNQVWRIRIYGAFSIGADYNDVQSKRSGGPRLFSLHGLCGGSGRIDHQGNNIGLRCYLVHQFNSLRHKGHVVVANAREVPRWSVEACNKT